MTEKKGRPTPGRRPHPNGRFTLRVKPPRPGRHHSNWLERLFDKRRKAGRKRAKLSRRRNRKAR